MASLRKNGSTFVICFRYAGRQVQRSLKTDDRRRAETLRSEIESRLGRLALGERSLPDGVDPVEYVLTGREVPAASAEPSLPTPQPPPVPSAAEAIAGYLAERRVVLAETTCVTERIHLANVVAALDGLRCGRPTSDGRAVPSADRPLSEIPTDLFRQALAARAAEVASTTVGKERQTLRGFLAWAAARWDLPALAAVELPKFKKNTRGDRFLTCAEVEEAVARGGLTEAETAGLWSRLYLLPDEVAEVLTLVRARATSDFVVTLHLLIAYTGMRRGEARRLRWADVDLARRRVTVRSLKQSRSEAETFREVDLHPDLAAALTEYRVSRPRGQFVLSRLGAPGPLTVAEIAHHYRQPLRGTRWEREIGGGRRRVVVRPHLMRHSFASCLAAAGVDQRVIDRFVGHVTAAMARHYQHVAPAARRSAVERLGFGSAPGPKGGADDAA